METSKSIKSLPATFRWIDDKKLCGSFGLAGLVSWSVVNRVPKIWKWVKANVVLTACKSRDGGDCVCWWKSVSFQSIVENQLLLYILCCCWYQLYFTVSFLISGFEHLRKKLLYSGGLLASWKFLSKSRQISEQVATQNLQRPSTQ